ncbi:MAG: alanine--tRNA ligase [Marinilabiliales bacterium]|nr:MAG: alanine--tRNA ligase [Marinilabiliales bacterium]
MMNSKQIRNTFKEYFEQKGHKIVASDSMVIKGDHTLMFTNAGMNQFKDIFLDIRKPESVRVANSQKCLRVSGKHNDLEDVGQDTYHNTMFEMLGNWSFGDYFKAEAIEYAWDYLTNVLKISEENLYVTVFGGAKEDNMLVDTEAEDLWLRFVPKEKIVYGSKKDNFWEMGETGPCGPCSEVHIDLRDEEDKKKVPARDLINMDHNEVIEIWNLVFIQYNRKSDGSLESLPQKHVDTGMGFERLCAVLQGKKSNYDTDLFQTIIGEITKISGKKYGVDHPTDVALRVVSDHMRAVSFAIADGQLPSNNKAGYVIRRILRRAVRYAYSFLDVKEPFIFKLVDTLADLMGESFPEILAQKELVAKVIKEEESVFLRTLDKGIGLLDTEMQKLKKEGKTEIGGKEAFVLYDTFGFPLDLTELISRENGFTVNKPEFDAEMQKQKDRARNAADVDTGDWVVLNADAEDCEFVGYEELEANVKIVKYRKVEQKKTILYHLVFDRTPFYSESGGQVGDTGYIQSGEKKYSIVNTVKEHNQILHILKQLPDDQTDEFRAVVSAHKRSSIAANHTATHLLHFALRDVLGTHVEQKGSLVDSERLRFDFSHFNKLTEEEIRDIEISVNKLIRFDISRTEKREMSMDDAKSMGAISLFGEKYGDKVRVIKFGDSVELCGGTHVESTGKIGFFKIVSEGGVAAGIRRIEAVTGDAAEKMILAKLDTLSSISEMFNNPKDVISAVQSLIDENAKLKKQVEQYKLAELKTLKKDLISDAEEHNGVKLIAEKVEVGSSNDLKEICAQLRGELSTFACVLGAVIDNKPAIAIAFSEDLIKEKGMHAGNLIREAAKLVQGGGGGQPFVATAGGKNPDGVPDAIEFAKKEILSKI